MSWYKRVLASCTVLLSASVDGVGRQRWVFRPHLSGVPALSVAKRRTASSRRRMFNLKAGKRRISMVSRVSVISSTWGMPKFDLSIHAALQRVSVKRFSRPPGISTMSAFAGGTGK